MGREAPGEIAGRIAQWIERWFPKVEGWSPSSPNKVTSSNVPINFNYSIFNKCFRFIFKSKEYS